MSSFESTGVVPAQPTGKKPAAVEISRLKVFEALEPAEQHFDQAHVERLAQQLARESQERFGLGRGDSGVVWYSADPFFGNSLCVKELYNDQASVNSLEREFELLSQAHTAGVTTPKPLFYLQSSEGQYIVMQRLPGKSVKDCIAAGEFLDTPAWQTFRASLERQVVALHRKALLHHRDLHLGNVMVLPDNTAAIIDFGDARAATPYDTEDDIYKQNVVRDGRYLDVVFEPDRNVFDEAVKVRRRVVSGPTSLNLTPSAK